jgi:K+-sensing histidine kinase KdpD
MSEESPEKLQRLAEESYTTFLQLVPVKPPPQSVIYAPLISKKRCVGSIILMSFRDANAFTPSHIHLLQAIANDVAMVVENIELSKEAEEARVLRETDRLKSQFISAVSHELRTPLTSIKGYSTSLLRQDVSWDEETKREFLQAIDEKADELQDLIDKLLQTAKVEAGSIKINKEPVLVSHLAQEVVAEASSRDGKHQLEVDFPSPFPVIEGDAHYLRVILRNLIDNAIKYSPAGGKIRVSGRRYADKILVSVSDQGIGIPVEHQQRIFDRFYRIENELTRRTSGSGLGLFIVRGLVEAHGGEVWVESTKGGGSTFFFTLPVERVETTES